MPFPTFVASGALSESTVTITPVLPAGILADDILLAFFSTANEAVTIPTPNGGTWTQVTNSPQGSGVAGGAGSRLTVFWSRYNGVQGNPTTNDPGNHIGGRISAFRGCITAGNPFNISSGAAGSTAAITVPGATTTVADCLVVMALTTGDSSDVLGAPANASFAGIVSLFNSAIGSGNTSRMRVSTGEDAVAGLYGSTTSTTDGDDWGGMTIALQPPAVAVQSVAAWIQDDAG